MKDYRPDDLGLGVNKNKFVEVSSIFSIIVTIVSIVEFDLLCFYRRE